MSGAVWAIASARCFDPPKKMKVLVSAPTKVLGWAPTEVLGWAQTEVLEWEQHSV